MPAKRGIYETAGRLGARFKDRYIPRRKIARYLKSHQFSGYFQKAACIVAVSWLSDTIPPEIGRNCDLCVDYTCGRETAKTATGHLPAKTRDRSYPQTSIHSKRHVYIAHKSKFLPEIAGIVFGAGSGVGTAAKPH